MIREPKKIAKSSRSIFYPSFSNYLPLVLFMVFWEFFWPFRFFEIVKWGCIYRKMECRGGCGRNPETLTDHCQLSNMANWDWYGNKVIFGICLKMHTHLRRVRTHLERCVRHLKVREPFWVCWRGVCIHKGCVRFLRGCICSLGLVWAFGLWYEFRLIQNLLSGSLLKVIFDRQE